MRRNQVAGGAECQTTHFEKHFERSGRKENPLRSKCASVSVSGPGYFYFFQSITHHGQSLLVADVDAVTHTPP